jgi:AraC-like DNA-binding protein
MLFEPTTLTAAAAVIAETLESHYATDPKPIFEQVGLDYAQLGVADARYPWKDMQALWLASVEATGDPSFGLYAGRRIRPTTFHAVGYSWLSSATLVGSLERLCRYFRVISTAPVQPILEQRGQIYALTEVMPDPTHVPIEASVDAFLAAIVQMCRTATTEHFAPAAVTVEHADRGNTADYVAVLGCPIQFEAPRTEILFDAESLETPLRGNNAELARANDKVAEQYLEKLDPDRVASEVRELLVSLLPSGKSSQEIIAKRMNRSLSTLQRQLQSEGMSYQAIRDETRNVLAQEYVRQENLSLSQIAYMLGFSDQSNFSRAFKRWTGQTPREFRH